MLPGPPKSSQTESKMAILAPSWPILGAICCQLGPSCVHLGPIFAPTSPKISTKSRQESQEAPPDNPRPPRGSPKGSRTAPGAEFAWFWDFGFNFSGFSFSLSFYSSWPPCLKFGTVAAWRAQRTGYLHLHWRRRIQTNISLRASF